jgi:plastocyanin
LTLGVLAACGGVPRNIVPDPTPANGQQVVIYGYKFKPQTMTVARGATVSWINRDTAPHTATRHSENDEPFDSGNLAFEAGFTHTFQSAGSFHYLCIYHPGMQGTVVVQ